MASVQHVYRRGAIFWWRRCLPLFSSRKLDIRLSLRTADRQEARERGAALTAATREVVRMVEDRVRAADARPTEDELQAMARQAYAEKLAQFCDDQRAYPHHAVDHERANRTWADFYDRLVRNGGHAAMLDGEEQAWRMMGWDAQRVANLRVAIAHVEEGNPPISRRFVDHYLREFGYEPHNGLRRMVERALHPAYRDACLEAERRRRGAIEPASASPYAEPAQASATATAVDRSSADQGAYFSDFIEAAIAALVANERWDGKSGRQARSTIALFELLIGRKKLGAYHQDDLTAFMKKLRFVPKQYDMTRAESRKSILNHVAAGEAAAEKADGKPIAGERSNRTRNRHLSSLAAIVRWGITNKRGKPDITFDKQFAIVSKRKRARSERPATSKDDVAALFAMPTWTGSQPHRGGTGAAVLRARVTPGDAIVHDAFYWVPLPLYYTGARREEICKLCPGDVKLAPIPHFFIDFTDFGRIKNDQSVRPVPLHRELVRLGFLQFVEECRKRGYPVLFPELTPTNDVQKFGDIYYKNVWANLKRAAKLADDATNHGMRHRFSTDLKAKKVFSEFRRDVMGQGGLDINEERYSDTAAMEILKGIIEELPSVTDALQPGKAIVPPRVIRRPKPSMRRK
nr:DUF6538 domain-containing protein [uncultured Sphingomonas sp.]